MNECYTSYGRPLRHSDTGQYNRRYRAGAISRRMCVHGMLTSVCAAHVTHMVCVRSVWRVRPAWHAWLRSVKLLMYAYSAAPGMAMGGRASHLVVVGGELVG